MNVSNAAPPPIPLSTLAEFDHQPRVRLIFGNGSSMQAGQLARDYGARRVLLVTDPGIVAVGHAGRIQGYLEAAGLDVAIFGDSDQNPTDATVARCLAVARSASSDFIVGLGGGSAMDT